MPDDLKKTLLSRNAPEPPDPQLQVEQALMRLSTAYPQAMEVSTFPADGYMKFLNADAAVHPFMPNTIWHRSDLTESPDKLDRTLAHELSHVGSMKQQGTAMNRILTAILGQKSSYGERDEELNAEASATRHMSKRRGDIPLPEDK